MTNQKRIFHNVVVAKSKLLCMALLLMAVAVLVVYAVNRCDCIIYNDQHDVMISTGAGSIVLLDKGAVYLYRLDDGYIKNNYYQVLADKTVMNLVTDKTGDAALAEIASDNDTRQLWYISKYINKLHVSSNNNITCMAFSMIDDSFCYCDNDNVIRVCTVYGDEIIEQYKMVIPKNIISMDILKNNKGLLAASVQCSKSKLYIFSGCLLWIYEYNEKKWFKHQIEGHSMKVSDKYIYYIGKQRNIYQYDLISDNIVIIHEPERAYVYPNGFIVRYDNKYILYDRPKVVGGHEWVLKDISRNKTIVIDKPHRMRYMLGDVVAWITPQKMDADPGE